MTIFYLLCSSLLYFPLMWTESWSVENHFPLHLLFILLLTENAREWNHNCCTVQEIRAEWWGLTLRSPSLLIPHNYPGSQRREPQTIHHLCVSLCKVLTVYQGLCHHFPNLYLLMLTATRQDCHNLHFTVAKTHRG